MNPLIPLRKAAPLLLIVLALVPVAQAVVPAPDGGYPGGNTAEGQNALLSLTTGGFNAGIGWLSLRGLTTGSFNTGVGAGTLALNNADQNTATGTGALLSNTSGSQNTANGAFALFSNTEGNNNAAIGDGALFSNTTGEANTANGYRALNLNTTGEGNTANGVSALASNTTGNENTANGVLALFVNTIGVSNTANGVLALFSNRSGDHNTANGVQALERNTTGFFNTANGYLTLGNNTTGSNNTAFGVGAGINVTTANNVIAIGTDGANVSNSCFIGRIRGVTTANADAIPVLIDSAGQLGTMSSSRRFKKQIKPMDQASEFIHALKPVTFQYKSDNTNRPEFGLIAEEVAEVNPDLVIRDENGEIYTVRYDAVNAMLLNEFLKEHRKNERQEATIMRLQKQIEALAADLQKVSAHLELSKPAPQTVFNSR
jgi:trimeric autotransporter adhesin